MLRWISPPVSVNFSACRIPHGVCPLCPPLKSDAFPSARLLEIPRLLKLHYCLDIDTKNTALGQISKVEYGCPSGRRIASDRLRSKSPHQNGTAVDSFLLKCPRMKKKKKKKKIGLIFGSTRSMQSYILTSSRHATLLIKNGADIASS